MATVPVPATWNGGIVPTSTLNSGVRDPLIYALAPPLAMVHQESSQSLTSSSWTAITMDTETYDTADGHSTSTNTSRYTAVYPGYYLLGGGVTYAGNTTGRRGARWAVNGSVIPGSATLQVATSATSVGVTARGMVTYLTVGDYVELQGYQDSGGALSTYVTASDSYSSMSVVWVSN